MSIWIAESDRGGDLLAALGPAEKVIRWSTETPDNLGTTGTGFYQPDLMALGRLKHAVLLP